MTDTPQQDTAIRSSGDHARDRQIERGKGSILWCRRTLLASIAAFFGLLFGWIAPAAADPIAPEQAFQMSARSVAPDAIEITFKIRKAYYLYGNKFRFISEDERVVLGEALRPPGKMHSDEYFGEVETYRDAVNILLPVTAPADTLEVPLTVMSQGCWDGGICYPPLSQTVSVVLGASAPAPSDNLLDRALIGSDASTLSAGITPAGGDESGRIANLLRDATVPLILLSFFGFGLLLAFTPCTFPMIPILSGIIVGQGARITRTRALVLSLVYVLGMACTYAIAGVAAGLSGTLLAAALQNVWVLGAFALVFVVLALSMFGFYELQLPSGLQSKLSSSAAHQPGGSLGGVAVMGVLSALIVGPCVAAPLAGALLYIAQSGDAVLGGVALFVMALGMGAPLIAVGVGTRSLLPKVGPWMEGVKKAFGVMLLAVAVWLLTPVLPDMLVMLAWAALLLFSGVFLHALDPLPSHAKNWQRFWKGVGVVMLLAGASMLIGALAGSRDPLQPLAVLRAQAGSVQPGAVFERVNSLAELDSRLASSERPVMLDFYADWCVSCKEMERFTFSDPAVAARMNQMLLLKADVTANNDDHKALLQRFGLFGPPGIIFFRPGGDEINDIRVVGFMRAAPFSDLLEQVLAR